jgi:hypothetical protein
VTILRKESLGRQWRWQQGETEESRSTTSANNATLAGYANTTEIPVPAAGWGATQELRELVRRTTQAN